MRCGISTALVVLGLAGGCAATGGPESPPLEGKLSSNGLTLDTGLLGDLVTAPLGDGATGAALHLAPAHDALAADPAGRELLGYLALCALDPGTSLEVGADRHEGLYGLAPEWADADCDESCQRWVTACVLAHANAFGDHVTVSLRGDHPGLRWTDDISAEFASQEGAFYGNLFASPPTMYSCAGRAFALEGETYLDRLCGLSGLCGISFTGECHHPGVDVPTDVDLEDPGSTCKDDAGEAGFYERCHVTIGDVFGSGPAFDDVITVYTSRP